MPHRFRRRWLALVAASLLGLLGVWLDSKGESPPRPATGDSAPPVDRTAPRPLDALTRSPDRWRPRGQAATSVTRVQSSVSPPGSLPADCVSSGIVLTDDGRPFEASGTMSLASVDEDADDVVATIDRGRVQARCPRAGAYRICSLRLNGAYTPLPVAPVRIDCGGIFEVRVPAPVSSSIEVVAAERGAPIAGAIAVEVTRASTGSSFGSAGAPWPGTIRGSLIVADDTDVLTFPPDWGGREWHVGAAGRSWTAFESMKSGGRTRVSLWPAGRIRVHVIGWPELASPSIEVASDDGRGFARIPPPSGGDVTELGGLPVGRWQVRVVDSAGPARTYAESTVEVRFGETSFVELFPDASVRLKPVHVVLRVHLPSAWSLPESFKVAFFPVGGSSFRGDLVETARDGSDGAVARATIPMGDYYLLVGPIVWWTLIHVGAETSDVTVDVPSPVNLDLRIVDSETGEIVHRAVVDGSGEDVGFDATRNVYRRRVPRGESRLSVAADGYAVRESVWIDASSEPSIAEIKLEKLGTLVVHILGDARDGSAFAYGRSGEATDGARDADIVGGEATFRDLPPGRWKVTIRDEDEDKFGPERECLVRPGAVATTAASSAPRMSAATTRTSCPAARRAATMLPSEYDSSARKRTN